MWTLNPIINTKSSKNGDEAKYLLVGKKYVIGRNFADIIVEHKSISRKHGEIDVSFSIADMSNPKILPKCQLKDFSKFGTFVNGTNLKGGLCSLSSGDIIKFGDQPGVEYACNYKPLVVVTSSLIALQKRELKETIHQLGGHMLNEWTDICNLLVMESLTVTYKVICCLLMCAQIVKPQYISDMFQYIQGHTEEKPQVHDYVPPVIDSDISSQNVNFAPLKTRKFLFKNKTFVFLSEEKMGRYSVPISLGGGKSLVYSPSSSLSVTDPHVIVVYEVSTEPVIKNMIRELVSAKRRPIIDVEIGFAVLFNSLDNYCNVTRKCDSKIYKDSGLSQVLSSNPFNFMESQTTQSLEHSHHHQPTSDISLVNQKTALSQEIRKRKSTRLFDMEADDELPSPSSKSRKVIQSDTIESTNPPNSSNFLIPSKRTSSNRSIKPEVIVPETQEFLKRPPPRTSDGVTCIPASYLAMSLNNSTNQEEDEDDFDNIKIVRTSNNKSKKSESSPVKTESHEDNNLSLKMPFQVLPSSSSSRPTQASTLSTNNPPTSFTPFSPLTESLDVQSCSLTKEKKEPLSDENDEFESICCPVVVATVDLVVQNNRGRDCPPSVISSRPNFKRFKKKGAERVFIPRTIVTMQIYNPNDMELQERSRALASYENESEDKSQLNSKADQLFEQMCFIPRHKK